MHTEKKVLVGYMICLGQRLKWRRVQISSQWLDLDNMTVDKI